MMYYFVANKRALMRHNFTLVTSKSGDFQAFCFVPSYRKGDLSDLKHCSACDKATSHFIGYSRNNLINQNYSGGIERLESEGKSQKEITNELLNRATIQQCVECLRQNEKDKFDSFVKESLEREVILTQRDKEMKAEAKREANQGGGFG